MNKVQIIKDAMEKLKTHLNDLELFCKMNGTTNLAVVVMHQARLILVMQDLFVDLLSNHELCNQIDFIPASRLLGQRGSPSTTVATVQTKPESEIFEMAQEAHKFQTPKCHQNNPMELSVQESPQNHDETQEYNKTTESPVQMFVSSSENTKSTDKQCKKRLLNQPGQQFDNHNGDDCLLMKKLKLQ